MLSWTRVSAMTAAIVIAGISATAAASSQAGAEPHVSCSSPSPCVSDLNSGSGPGLASTSLLGNGLFGKTLFNSTGPSNAKSGVVGVDGSASSGFNAGVTGTSKNGTGVSGSGGGIGVIGKSTNGTGAAGVSKNGYGVSGSSQKSNGVVGISNGTGSTFAGVLGVNNSTNTAVEALGSGGPLFIGHGSGGSDVFKVDDAGDVLISHEFASGLDQNTAFGVEGMGNSIGVVGIGGTSNAAGVASTAVGGGAMYVATNASNTRTLLADDSGNLTITGLIFTAGGCSTGCVKNQREPGMRVVSYSPHEAAPTMEDVGEGQLVDGRTYVALDPSFANVIDPPSSYFVFITPEGDNRGLYVADKTLHGFSVRESQGGHSTLPFSYRIVAKPYGANQARLPRVNFAAQPAILRPHAPAHPGK